MARITLITPARLSGSTEEQLGQVFQYQQQLYGILTNIAKALATVRALPLLELTISNPPTQAEVQAIADRVDAITAALPEIT